MTSNELRLGNWITDGKFNMVVSGIMPDTIYGKVSDWGEYHLRYDIVDGIPITSEILDNCLTSNSGLSWGGFEFSIEDNDGLWEVYFCTNYIRTVEFVHELQNVYYLILQKELNIKL